MKGFAKEKNVYSENSSSKPLSFVLGSSWMKTNNEKILEEKNLYCVLGSSYIELGKLRDLWEKNLCCS